MRPARASSLAAILAAIVLTIAGCGASDNGDAAPAPAAPEAAADPAANPTPGAVAPDQTLEFVAHDFSFEGPATARAGLRS